MRDLRIGAAQFEAMDGLKEYNLQQIKWLGKEAVMLGAEVCSFHEMCVTGYSFLQDATREQMLAVAEPVPTGPSCVALHEIAFELQVPVLAGLLEVDRTDGKLYNTYVCVHPTQGVIARHRKLHAFLNPQCVSQSAQPLFCLFGSLVLC